MRQTAGMLQQALCLPVLLLGAAGCNSHESFDSTNDYDAVVTVKDPDYDYTKNRTYALVEEVKDLSDQVSDPIEIEDRERWEAVILSAIRRNMEAAGYTEETGDMEDADAVVAAGMVAAENWAFYGYYPWWGWDGWYYYPGYGVAVDFSSGSVVLMMIDPDRTDAVDGTGSAAGGDAGADGGDDTEAHPVVWGAGLHGLLHSVTEKKVNNGIDQAFAQSPYLQVEGGAR